MASGGLQCVWRGLSGPVGGVRASWSCAWLPVLLKIETVPFDLALHFSRKDPIWLDRVKFAVISCYPHDPIWAAKSLLRYTECLKGFHPTIMP